MSLLLAISKMTGARCNDLLKLRWGDIEEKENGISFFPSDYKNARLDRSWRFFVFKTDEYDCVLKALNKLKPPSFMRSDYKSFSTNKSRNFLII